MPLKFAIGKASLAALAAQSAAQCNCRIDWSKLPMSSERWIPLPFANIAGQSIIQVCTHWTSLIHCEVLCHIAMLTCPRVSTGEPGYLYHQPMVHWCMAAGQFFFRLARVNEPSIVMFIVYIHEKQSWVALTMVNKHPWHRMAMVIIDYDQTSQRPSQRCHFWSFTWPLLMVPDH